MAEPPDTTQGSENERLYRSIHREKGGQSPEKEEILNSLLFRIYYRELETETILNSIQNYLNS